MHFTFWVLHNYSQRECGLDDVMITEEMQSGDYMNLVKTMDKYFPFVVFETNNPEYMEAFHA